MRTSFSPKTALAIFIVALSLLCLTHQALALSPSVASEYERRGPRSLQQFGFGGGGCSSLSSILRVKQQEYQDKVQMMQIREENLRNKQVAASGRRRNLQGTDIGSDVLQAYNDAWATMAATLYGGREMVAGR